MALADADRQPANGVAHAERRADDGGLGFEMLSAMLHSARVLGYAPWLILSLYAWPRRTASGILAYYTLRFTSPKWNETVRALMRMGSSCRPRLVRAQTAPYDPRRQYILAAHPHGVLNFGYWNLFCRFGLDLFDGLQLVMCMAPAVQWYPLYGEIFGSRATDASASTIRRVLRETSRTPALIPGGFSEAVYTNADPEVEYAYLLGRKGFVRLAIEAGVDIIPSYTYGLNDMYKTLEWARHWRAVKAQATGIPMVFWWGSWGPLFGNVPHTEDVTVCTFDPFPASRYTLEQVDEAHAAYLVYLRECFDSRKAEAGAAHKRLEFIGSATPPSAPRPRARL